MGVRGVERRNSRNGAILDARPLLKPRGLDRRVEERRRSAGRRRGGDLVPTLLRSASESTCRHCPRCLGAEARGQGGM